ncbi:MAG: biopolymer transporter ExbD [Pseudomonadales bacterium]|nr:biopolymer transporter ExbD [Pseudomonadales bacterium]
MKKFISRTRKSEDAIVDMTPMLDVVFIMLIFFVVTASFIKEPGVDISPPGAKTGTSQEKKSLRIAIAKNGEIWFNGKRVDIRKVRSVLTRMKVESPNAGLIILVDKKATTDTLIAVMDSSRQAGIVDIAVATKQQ